ncbi:MAG: transposase [Terriglobia bacterium]
MTRRKFPAEEKIRIVLEGIRGEVAVSELCRREGIHPTIYYKWLRDFMEAGKGRMRGDTKREATSEEVRQLREEDERLKQLVAELSLATKLPRSNAPIPQSGPKCALYCATEGGAVPERPGGDIAGPTPIAARPR